jgi:hypothetical protein
MSKIHFPFYFWEKKSTKIVPEYNILKLLKENSKKIPRKFQENSKKIPRKFQENSEKIPRKFQENSKKIPSLRLSP